MSLFQNAPAAAVQDLGFLKVLYVEDNADIRCQLSQFLKRRFAEVLIAEDGAEGLKLYMQSEPRPDLVITDIRMPKIDGLAMVEDIKAIHPQQLVIMTTAHEETDYLIRAIDLGVDKFILKPVDSKQLHETLLYFAQQLQARQQLEEVRTALQESEARYRTLFWSAMDALTLFDWDSLEILEVNRQHQALFGFASRDLMGKKLDQLFAEQNLTKIKEWVVKTEQKRETLLINLQDSLGQAFPGEIVVASFSSNSQAFGLLTTRDASERLATMEEQKNLIDILEMTLDAVSELTSPN